MATTWNVNAGDRQTGWNKEVNRQDQLIFAPGAVGGNITVNTGGTVQLNTDVIIKNLVINDGHVYSSGPGPTIDGLTVNGGLFELRAGMTFLNNITLNWGNAVSWAGGPIYYNETTVLTINAGRMRMPTPQAIDGSGPLKVNLGPSGYFETYSYDLGNYFFNVTGDSFNIDLIDLKFYSGRVNSVTATSTGISINLSDGSSIRINGNFPGVQWRQGVEGGIEIYACFAEGTLIATPEGSRRVEELSVGDAIITHSGPQQITWIGQKTLNLHGDVPDESLLVHIRPHAFGDQQPSRDLWITSEHCVWVAGAMIPVRCLVNGTSIAYDRDRLHYTYYHFTLSEHAVIYAENLATESYRPDASRQRFDLPEPEASTVKPNAHLPILQSPETLRNAWAMLAERAASLGYGNHGAQSVQTPLREVRLRTDTGEVVPFIAANGTKAKFSVPAHTKYIVIESEACRPDQEIGPFIDDRRPLGVRVGAVAVHDRGRRNLVDRHLVATNIQGWNNVEDGHSRWTTGFGIIPLRAYGRPAHRVEVEVCFPDVQNLNFSTETQAS